MARPYISLYASYADVTSFGLVRKYDMRTKDHVRSSYQKESPINKPQLSAV